MNFYLKIFVVLFYTFSLNACISNTDNRKEVPQKNVKESLVKANKYLVIAENDEINNYINRRSWEMIETGTGLRYEIYEQGTGPEVVKGQIVVLNYELRLITGDLVYSSEMDGAKSFMVGYWGLETGLEEAVLFLKKGDKARIILPSHLAYGLLGDQKRIPSRSTLIYNVEVTNIIEQ